MKAASRWARFGLALAVLVAGALFLEAAARLRLYFQVGRTTTEFYEWRRDPVSGLRVPVPGQVRGSIRINSLGFRGPEIPVPKPPGTVRLAFLGGSTTFCTEASSDEATWPMRLAALLAERFPHRNFDVVNAALPAYRVADSLLNLRHRVAPLDPDVIVVYHATNDVSRDTRELAERQGLFTGEGGRRSALARVSVAWDLIEKNVRLRLRQRRALESEGKLRFDAEALAAAFERRLRSLLEEACSVAPVVAVCTFSTHFRRDQPLSEQLEAMNTSLYYMPYMDPPGLLAVFDAYNAAIRRAAGATCAQLVDGENEIPGDDVHFADSVHFTDRGCEAMARRVFERLVRNERFLALVGER